MGSLSSTLKSATTKPSRVTHFRARASSDNALSAGGKEIERERGVKRAERGFDLEGFFFSVSLKKKKIEKSKTKNQPLDPDLLPLRSAFTRVVAPLAAALCLCNADRICLAVAIVPMAAELGWKPATQGEEISVFFFEKVFF